MVEVWINQESEGGVMACDCGIWNDAWNCPNCPPFTEEQLDAKNAYRGKPDLIIDCGGNGSCKAFACVEKERDESVGLVGELYVALECVLANLVAVVEGSSLCTDAIKLGTEALKKAKGKR